jgi:hypothetical protein
MSIALGNSFVSPRISMFSSTLSRETLRLSGKQNYFSQEICFIRRILVASNAIKTIDNEMILNLIKLHYPLFELHSTRPKFDV